MKDSKLYLYCASFFSTTSKSGTIVYFTFIALSPRSLSSCGNFLPLQHPPIKNPAGHDSGHISTPWCNAHNSIHPSKNPAHPPPFLHQGLRHLQRIQSLPKTLPTNPRMSPQPSHAPESHKPFAELINLPALRANQSIPYIKSAKIGTWQQNHFSYFRRHCDSIVSQHKYTEGCRKLYADLRKGKEHHRDIKGEFPVSNKDKVLGILFLRLTTLEYWKYREQIVSWGERAGEYTWYIASCASTRACMLATSSSQLPNRHTNLITHLTLPFLAKTISLTFPHPPHLIIPPYHSHLSEDSLNPITPLASHPSSRFIAGLIVKRFFGF